MMILLNLSVTTHWHCSIESCSRWYICFYRFITNPVPFRCL